MLSGKHVFMTLVPVTFFLAALVSGGCVTSGEYNRLKDQLAKANETIDLKDQRIEELDHQLTVKQEEYLALQKEMGKFRQNSAEAEKLIADLKKRLADAEKARGGTQKSGLEGVEFFQPKDEGVGIRMADYVLFDSGSDILKLKGRQILDVLAEKLKSSNKTIRIVGHTDTDPVLKTKKKYPRGNIQLSTERAISVFQYLKQKGVPEKKMCVMGYGPNRPLVANDSAEHKRRNRRVEIILTD